MQILIQVIFIIDAIMLVALLLLKIFKKPLRRLIKRHKARKGVVDDSVSSAPKQ